jgi:hypothetical protein
MTISLLFFGGWELPNFIFIFYSYCFF